MSFFRQWILGISACALLVSLAEQLTPKGTIQKVVRFTGGLLMILSILQPVADVNLGRLSFDPDIYEQAVAALKPELAQKREDVLSDGIAQRTEAYIEDKATQLGLSVRAVVRTEIQQGMPLPKSVTLYGGENAELADYISQQLGIAKENQLWKESG